MSRNLFPAMLRTILVLGGWKARFGHLIAAPPRGGRAFSPGRLRGRCALSEARVEGFPLLTLSPRGGDPAGARRHVLLLHGGAYVVEATALHRRLALALVRRHGLRVSFLDYPMAPEHQAPDTHRVLRKAFEALRAAYPADELCLFGDSAGGGLALAFLQTLRNEGVAGRPRRTLLASPWVDLAMEDPAIPAYAALDPTLDREALLLAARSYAGDLDLGDSLLSPINGTLDDLGEVLLLWGTHEILVPDCRRLAACLAEAPGTRVETLVGEGLIHDWILIPFGPGRPAVDRAGEFFLR